MGNYTELAKDLRRCKTDEEDCFICDQVNQGYGKTHCRDVLHRKAADAIDELTAEVERLTRERDSGLCVMLPCKVGDSIYVIPSKTNYSLNKISHPENNRVHEQSVESVSWYRDGVYIVRTCSGVCESLSDDFGVTWFLTREAAEKALREGGAS